MSKSRQKSEIAPPSKTAPESNGVDYQALAAKLEKLDEDQLHRLIEEAPVGRKLQTFIRSEFRGPLPPPSVLHEYNTVLPGAAERILAMAEAEQSHRHTIDRTVVDAESRKERRGQIFGGAIALMALGVAGFLSYNDHDTVAGIIGGTTVVGLCSIFVIGRYLSQRE